MRKDTQNNYQRWSSKSMFLSVCFVVLAIQIGSHLYLESKIDNFTMAIRTEMHKFRCEMKGYPNRFDILEGKLREK